MSSKPAGGGFLEERERRGGIVEDVLGVLVEGEDCSISR